MPALQKSGGQHLRKLSCLIPQPTAVPPQTPPLLYNPSSKYFWSASCPRHQGLDLKAGTFRWSLAVSEQENKSAKMVSESSKHIKMTCGDERSALDVVGVG